MQSAIQLNQTQAIEFLLNVAVVRPVFMWGPPGIGKSALVRRFAAAVGMECVSLLGSQLAPEDLLGIPKIDGECSRFYPPANIVRKVPYVLFLDELNASSHEIQKAFYSLILEQRVGEYQLPPGTIVIGAGNRAKDAAIVKPMPSALINRLVHGAQAQTREISQALNSGKHTTTSTNWYWVDREQGTALIDSPGFQEFGLRHVDPMQLAAYMPDLKPHVAGCKFYNCTHLHEPGCGVLAVVGAACGVNDRRHRIYSDLFAELSASRY